MASPARSPAATAEGQFYTAAMTTIVGHGAASFFTVCIIASLLLSMTSSTADAGRALYGISRAGMTIKQFGVLNRFHVPGRAMTLDLGVNILLVILIKSNLAILYLSNIGYVLAHVFALSGFLLLRRDRPDWPRPIKVGRGWLPVAGFLCALNLLFLIVGALAPKLNGYGTWTDFWIGIAVLLGSLVLFVFRRDRPGRGEACTCARTPRRFRTQPSSPRWASRRPPRRRRRRRPRSRAPWR